MTDVVKTQTARITDDRSTAIDACSWWWTNCPQLAKFVERCPTMKICIIINRQHVLSQRHADRLTAIPKAKAKVPVRGAIHVQYRYLHRRCTHTSPSKLPVGLSNHSSQWWFTPETRSVSRIRFSGGGRSPNSWAVWLLYLIYRKNRRTLQISRSIPLFEPPANGRILGRHTKDHFWGNHHYLGVPITCRDVTWRDKYTPTPTRSVITHFRLHWFKTDALGVRKLLAFYCASCGNTEKSFRNVHPGRDDIRDNLFAKDGS